MTRDDIICMAREVADIETDSRGRQEFIFDSYGIKRFANLVAATEREACAKVCDELVIHAKAKGDTDAMFAAISCAIAIRIRGNNGQTS